MGHNKGIEPLHTGATIRRVNHFTNCTMTGITYIIKDFKKKQYPKCNFCDIIILWR